MNLRTTTVFASLKSAQQRNEDIEAWASRCLAHAECCGLKASQVEYLQWLRGEYFKFKELLKREPDRYPAWHAPYFLCGGFVSFAPLAQTQKPARIWAKIRRVHDIEGLSPEGSIERELEDYLRNQNERQLRELADLERMRQQRLAEPPTIFEGFTFEPPDKPLVRRV
jgi:hypothetical protein